MKSILVLLFCLGIRASALADAPAIDFYVLETATLKRLADGSSLDKLDHEPLSKVSKASGRLHGSSFSAQAAGVEILARFEWTDIPPKQVVYHITVKSRTDSFSIAGAAIRTDAQYVTPDGHGHPYVVLVRLRNLKQ